MTWPSHLKSIEDLSLSQIDATLKTAIEVQASLRKGQSPFSLLSPNEKKVAPLISAVTYFKEPSTRTKFGFERALQLLEIPTLHMDGANSSLIKGENWEQSFHALCQMGVRVFIYRIPELEIDVTPEYLPEKFYLLNSGNGTGEHPTQALGDLLTLMSLSPKLEGKKCTIVGDIRHSRVANSLGKLLPQYGMEVCFCSPANWKPQSPTDLEQHTEDLKAALSKSDFVYLLRVQKERHAAKADPSFMDNYIKDFGLTLEKWGNQKNKYILHPGPTNIGVELDLPLFRSPAFMGHRQVQSTMLIRTALMIQILRDMSPETTFNTYDWKGNSRESLLSQIPTR